MRQRLPPAETHGGESDRNSLHTCLRRRYQIDSVAPSRVHDLFPDLIAEMNTVLQATLTLTRFRFTRHQDLIESGRQLTAFDVLNKRLDVFGKSVVAANPVHIDHGH